MDKHFARGWQWVALSTPIAGTLLAVGGINKYNHDLHKPATLDYDTANMIFGAGFVVALVTGVIAYCHFKAAGRD